MGTVPVGTSVNVMHALVTGTGLNGFFVQVKETDAGYLGSDYSGMFVFAGTGSPFLAQTVGTRISIDGSVDNFQGELELDGLTAVTLLSGVEAILAATPGSSPAMTLSPWNVGGGGEAPDGGN